MFVVYFVVFDFYLLNGGVLCKVVAVNCEFGDLLGVMFGVFVLLF